MYKEKIETKADRKVVVDDMILTKDFPTTAGSKMLEGYMSLFDASVLSRLAENGFELSGKARVGEFDFDLLGETAFGGATEKNGEIVNASAEILKAGEALAAINLDVNGTPRRAAAQNDLIYIKPTYGTVSRFGTIPVVCSGETVGVMASELDDCKEALMAIIGYDDKDGTSLPEQMCEKVKAGFEGAKVSKVAVLVPFVKRADDAVSGKVEAFAAKLKECGIELENVENFDVESARVAWNILMCAELCNNVSRYDGVKYGYRTENFTNIDELYTNSRTEAFGDVLKAAILFGSETLSTENYFKVYDKALRVRRVICEEFNKLFEKYDAVILPACSAMKYSKEQIEKDKYAAFEENLYTAPASITGLPAMVAGGVQIIGKAFSEGKLFEIAKLYKEGK